jgi:thiol-disulfide isomerase/thioredoxin
MNKTWPWIIGIVTIVILVGGAWLGSSASPASSVPAGKYTAFAQCLADKKLTFYGAWWCPHCQNTKSLFGDAVKLLPYVECSTPDGKGRLPVCVDAKVDVYPTWQFPDGSRETGELTLEHLAEKSGCALPASPSQGGSAEQA